MTKDFSSDSGERVSAVTDDRIITDHLARYRYAASYVRKHLGHGEQLFGADIFCGSGYGTNILARDTGATVVGIDGSAEAISQANLSFPRSNILFTSKIFPFSLPQYSFDFICSFESIEHILDDDEFAARLAMSLKHGGLLFVSCPNADRVDLSINPYHWHFKHLTPQQFKSQFTRLGLDLVECLSTLCVIPNEDRKVIAVNHFAIPRNEIRSDMSGDTMLFIFRRPQR